MKTLIYNIGTLGQVSTDKMPFLRGKAMTQVESLSNAWLLIEEDKIAQWGSMEDCTMQADKLIDAKQGWLLPTWCDSHTHLVFAASRENEFVDRIKGLSYAEIAAKGGGILNSAKRLNKMSEDELFDQALERLHEVASYGTGAIEIKSGYGLAYEGELKMLRVIRRLKESSPLHIKATFLGAHAYPMEYKNNKEAYMDLLLKRLLPTIASEGLADYVDAFCEKGFFSVEDTERIMEAGQQYGLKAKIHTNQFNCMGGIQAAVKYNAISVDHLEVLNEEEIACLLNSQTIPTLLPSAPFFINDHYPPARQMIDAGLGVALATDFNPGSTPSGRMSFVLSLACIKMGMLPEEAFNAATINAAYAMELDQDLGSIERDKTANLMLLKPMESLAYIPYAFGSNLVEKVFIKGKEL